MIFVEFNIISGHQNKIEPQNNLVGGSAKNANCLQKNMSSWLTLKMDHNVHKQNVLIDNIHIQDYGALMSKPSLNKELQC